jgi:hypothetical protein
MGGWGFDSEYSVEVSTKVYRLSITFLLAFEIEL